MGLSAKALSEIINFTRASSATRINAAGQIESVAANQPRFDFDPVTLQPKGILIEEQRTNLCPRSSEFGNAVWVAPSAAADVIENAIQAPDGTMTGDVIKAPDASANYRRKYVLAKTADSLSYVASIFIKKTTSSPNTPVINLIFEGGTIVQTSIAVNPNTGACTRTVGLGAFSSQGELIDGWWRVWLAATDNGTNNSTGVNLVATNAAPLEGAEFGAWGFQLEAGSFVSSYIPTSGAQATRAGDVATTPFASWANSAEGTFFIKVDTTKAGSYANWIDTSVSNQLFMRHAAKNTFEGKIFGTTIPSAAIPGLTIAGGVIKAAISYSAGQARLAINGQIVGSISVVATPFTGTIHFGKTGWGNAGQLGGGAHQFRYLKKSLTNTELQALTA